MYRSITISVSLLMVVFMMLAGCAGPAATPTKSPVESKPAAPTVAAKPTTNPTDVPQATTSAKPTAPAQAPASTAGAVKPLDPPVNIKFGTLMITGDAGLLVALDRGYFKEEGINLELIRFRSAADVIAPLATGELDFGAGSINPGYFNALARGLDLRIVSDKVTWNFGMTGAAMMVRKDLYDSGAVKDISQSKGRSVAVNLRANSSEMYVDMALNKGGLTIDDVNVVTLGFPDMLPAMANKGIDIAYMIEPFVTTAQEMGVGQLLMDVDKIHPGEMAMAMIVSPVIAQKNPEAVRRVVTAHLRGQRDYYDAFVKGKGDKDSIITILTKYTDLKDPQMYKKMKLHAVMPNGTVDTQILLKDQEYYLKKGWIKEKVDVSKLVDTQYIEYALKRLGKYDEPPR